jgi:hypothetical protein
MKIIEKYFLFIVQLNSRSNSIRQGKISIYADVIELVPERLSKSSQLAA